MNSKSSTGISSQPGPTGINDPAIRGATYVKPNGTVFVGHKEPRTLDQPVDLTLVRNLEDQTLWKAVKDGTLGAVEPYES